MPYIKEIVVNTGGKRVRYELPDVDAKANKATTLAGYGITDVSLSGVRDKTLKIGSKTITVALDSELSEIAQEVSDGQAMLEAIGAMLEDLRDELHTHLICEYGHGVNFDAATTTSTARMFQGDTRLRRVPQWDFSKVKDASYMFDGCTALTEADMDMPALENSTFMFQDCDNLRKANMRCSPVLMNNMFWATSSHTSKLEQVVGLDFSRATRASYMFNTTRLNKLPDVIDLAKCTNAQALFFVPTSEEVAPLSIPDIDFSHATNTYNLFRGRASTLRYPAVIDCSNSSDVGCMFQMNRDLTEELVSRVILPGDKKFSADSLFATWIWGSSTGNHQPTGAADNFKTLIPTFPTQFDFSNCTNMASAFAGWTEITEATINVSSVLPDKDYPKLYGNPFINCEKLTKRTYIGIGTQESMKCFPLKGYVDEGYRIPDVWGSGSEEARQTIVDSLLRYSFDRAAAGYDSCTLILTTEVAERLSDTEKAAIIARGYTIQAV